MQTITKFLVLLLLVVISTHVQAQDSIKISNNQLKIEALIKQKSKVEADEKELLKAEVEAINKQLESGEISEEQAQQLKQESAQKRALNIENRLAIIDNQIALLERNNMLSSSSEENEHKISIQIGDGKKGITINSEKKPIKYDIRTSNDFLFAIGFNNTLIDNGSLDDSPYKFGGSGFVELGWNWKTRLLKNSDFIRVKYGFSFQWNKLNPKSDQYFVQDGDVTTLQDFPTDLRKSEFRVTNLVFPVYFEFGPLKKIERESHIRYINSNKFKIGLGAYGGFRLGTQQKLKFKEDGDNVKQKTRKDFNTSNLVYGLGAYVGFGDTSLYVKYDLNPLFKNQLVDQNNISLGLRFDID